MYVKKERENEQMDNTFDNLCLWQDINIYHNTDGVFINHDDLYLHLTLPIMIFKMIDSCYKDALVQNQSMKLDRVIN